MNAPTDDQVVKIAERICGTCNSIETEFENDGFDFYDLAQDQYGLIDEITLECDTCNWWCEPCEFNSEIEDNQTCNDCIDS